MSAAAACDARGRFDALLTRTCPVCPLAANPVASIQPYSTKYQLGSAPFLEPDPNSWRNPNNIQPKLRDCELQCLGLPTCRYGTYITSGPRRGECWLAANTTATLSPCNVQCQSFVKVRHKKPASLPLQPAHSAGKNWPPRKKPRRARASAACRCCAAPCATSLLTNYFFLTTLRHAEIKRAEQLLKKAMSQQLTKEAVARAEQRIQSDEDKLLNVLHHAQKSNLAGSSQCPLGRYSTLVFDGHASTASGFKRKCAACPPGKFATGDLQFCVSCAAGTYQRYSASGSCVNCPSGMYQSSEAQTECIDCPASKWQHQPGESFCGRGTCLLLPVVFDGAHSTLHTESNFSSTFLLLLLGTPTCSLLANFSCFSAFCRL